MARLLAVLALTSGPMILGVKALTVALALHI